MTSMLIRNADGIFTGLPGDAMRASGAIRVRDGRIAAIGDLAPEPGEEVIDALRHLSGSRIDAPPSVSEHPQECSRRDKSAADPKRRSKITATDLHQGTDYTPYEGFEVTG